MHDHSFSIPLPGPRADEPLLALAAAGRSANNLAWAPLDHARVLDAYADALVAAKNPGAAADARAEGVRLRAQPGSRASVTDLLLGHVGVADTATTALRFDDAFAAIAAAREVLRGRESAASRAGLLRAEAAVADCAGDSVRAVELSDAAAAIAPPPQGPIREPAHVTIATDRIRYLRRAAATVASSPAASAAARRFLDEASRLADALVAGGVYGDPDQLPRTFTRGLPPGRPWHSFARGGGGYPELRPLRRLLEDAAAALRAEFAALQAGGHLLVEQECIHDPSSSAAAPDVAAASGSGPASRLGSWTYFTVNGPWLRGRDERGCASAIAPVACALLANATALRGAGGAPLARILRGGYSALAGRGHIRPHCGLTNTQLKMHVGLVTPSFDDVGDGGQQLQRPCAALTVGNETRAWEAGRVLFFDDSFTHAVANACDALRVVFQLVIAHPAIPTTGAGSSLGGGAGGD